MADGPLANSNNDCYPIEFIQYNTFNRSIRVPNYFIIQRE